MSDFNDEFPTIIGSDATFKGELSFDKGVRVEGKLEGQINSKGTLHIGEGATIHADINAANVKVEGECKGNVVVSEKLHLLATARMEGDLRTTRLEIADGAIFVGKVVVGQAASESPARRPETGVPSMISPTTTREPAKVGPTPVAPGAPKPRPHERPISANP